MAESIKRKGRGHTYKEKEEEDDTRGGVFERIEQEKNFGPSQCELSVLHFVN